MPFQLAWIRWFALAIAVVALLQATVFFEISERLLGRWWSWNERLSGRPAPALLKNRTLHRAWALFSVVAFTVIWWFLGTPHAQALFQQPQS
jgi:hypothetical protein